MYWVIFGHKCKIIQPEAPFMAWLEPPSFSSRRTAFPLNYPSASWSSSPEMSATNTGYLQLGNLRDQRPLCVPWSLPGPANACLPNICFSTWVAFLPSEVHSHSPNHGFYVISWSSYLKWGLCTLAWVTHFSGVSPISTLLNSYLIFLPFICLMSIQVLDQPEQPRRVEKNFFLPDPLKAALLPLSCLPASFPL